ncbi:MAG: hypothetical protein V3R82_06150, partial [Candidatus Hydrothermarchaeales archaeon]
EEIDFAYTLFKHLSVGELDSAKEYSEEFLENWKSAGLEKEVKEEKAEEPGRLGKSTLEVTR